MYAQREKKTNPKAFDALWFAEHDSKIEKLLHNTMDHVGRLQKV
jgi:hypothetical protein